MRCKCWGMAGVSCDCHVTFLCAGLPYSMPIDMWSLGCILAELYTGYPLFPGENEVEQLACIMEVFDYPPNSLLVEAQRRKLFFGQSPQSAVQGVCGIVQCSCVVVQGARGVV